MRTTKLSDVRMAALFLVSVCVLGFEIEVMRVFAVGSWSNFGSMVISIALLGTGVAGTLLTFLGDSVRRNPDGWLSVSAFSLGPSMAVAHTIAQHVPFNPVLIVSDPAQLWWIGAYYVIYGIPFFAGGLFIGVCFTAFSSRMHQLYFWNMIGSGAGGLAILGLMFVFPPDFLIYPLVGLAVIPALLSCVRWSPEENKPRMHLGEAAFTVGIAVISYALLLSFGRIFVSDFKPVSYAQRFPDSRQVYSAFSPLGEIKVYESSFFHFAPGLSDTASISLARMPRNAFLGLYIDGDGPVGVMRRLSAQEEGYIDFLPMAAPYLLLDHPRVLVLRLGGGAGIFTALHKGAREVWVVEPDSDLIHMMRDVPFFQGFTGKILDDPRVRVVNKEVRAFAGSTNQKFDLVELGLIDSTGLSQAGGYSVEENYTYTVEAVREYLKALTPSGVLSITVWDRLNPPRNVPRLLATVVRALREQGIPNVDKDIFSFNLLLSTATILVKKDGFTPRETGQLNRFCRRMSFDVNYYPGMPSDAKRFDKLMAGYADIYSGNPDNPSSASEPSASDAPPGSATAAPSPAAPEMDLRPADLYHLSLEWLLAHKQKELYSKYVFDIRPATDDRPYYSGYLKPQSIPQFLPRLGEISEEWGYLLLLATFLQSIIFGALIIVLPLVLRWRELFRGRRGTTGIIVYYACLGLAYLMAEIFLIQRFVFFLVNPVYANSIIITILLIASGIGSLVSGTLRVERRVKVLAAVLGIGIFVLFFLFAVPPLLDACLGLPLVLKVLITAALVAPMGFFMGVPFPTGLASLSESRKGILPWAWGVNGALSVTGSVLTRLLSTSLGFSVVLAVVAFLYILAGVLFPVNEPRLRHSD
jgi:predicted membrane-bound spermidine synthase